MNLNSSPLSGFNRARALMRVSRRVAVGILFVGMTIATLGVAAASTYNYYQFYPALSRLKLTWTSLEEVTMPDQIINATAMFALENPTGYRGLTLLELQPTVVFQRLDTNTTSPTQGLPIPHTKGPLDPGRNMTFTLTFVPREDQPGQFPRYILNINVVLSTFLDTVAIVVATYHCTAYLTPENCEQVAVSIHGLGGGGGAGA